MGNTAAIGVAKSKIPPLIYSRLNLRLMKQELFGSDEKLGAVFNNDSRISHWWVDLPQTATIRERVNGTIAYLWDHNGEDNQNALILFLSVLIDYVGPEDQTYAELRKLRQELENFLREEYSRQRAAHQKRFQQEFEDDIREEHRNVMGARKQLKESWDRIFERRKEYKENCREFPIEPKYPEDIEKIFTEFEQWHKFMSPSKEPPNTEKRGYPIGAIIIALIMGYLFGQISNRAVVPLNQAISYHTLTFPTTYLQADQSLDKFFLPADLPETNVLMRGVPFAFDSTHAFLQTQHEAGSHLPATLTIPVNQPRPKAVYLLMNLSNACEEVAPKDSVVGQIELVFDSGKSVKEDLKVGYNIREWVIGAKHCTVITTLSAPNAHSQVWTAKLNGQVPAVMDMLFLNVPAAYTDQTLTNIIISDSSMELRTLNPAIQVFAVTVTGE